MPTKFKLYPAYPNPFNAATSISFDLPDRENVSITIYNIQGKYVTTLIDNSLKAGHHKLLWDGKNSNGEIAGTGIYIIKIHSNSHVASVKAILLK